MNSLHARIRLFSIVTILLLPIAGCGIGGESIQDQMMARAKAKAERNREEKEAEAAREKELASRTPPPAAPAPPAAKAEPVVAKKPEPATNQVAISQEPPASTRIDHSGRILAFEREEGGLGLFDIQAKKMLQVIPDETSSWIDFDLHPGGQQLFAANSKGKVKVVSLNSASGLDVFEKRRRQRSVGSDELYAHDQAISAIASIGYSGGYATASSDGEIRFWNAPTPNVELGVAPGQLVSLQEYGDGKFLFAATNEAGKGHVKFWRMTGTQTENEDLKDYVELDGSATLMTQSVGGGGLAVGDSKGTTNVWSSEKGKIKKSVLQLSGSPITAISFLGEANGIVLGDQAGNLRQFSLPILPTRSFELPSAETLILAINGTGSNALIAVTPADLRLIRLRDGQATSRVTLPADKGAVSGVFLESDVNQLLAIGTQSGTIEFHDAVSGQHLGSTIVGLDNVSIKKLGNDGDLAFWTQDGNFGRLTPPTIATSFANPGQGSLQVAADTINALSLVVASDTRLTRVYEMGSGRIVGSTSLAGLDGNVSALQIHNGVAIFGTENGSLWIWQSNLPRARPRRLTDRATQSEIISIEVVNNTQVMTCDEAGSLRTVDLAKASEGPTQTELLFKREKPFNQMSIGTQIAFATAGEIEVLATTGESVAKLQASETKIASVASCPSSDRTAVGGDSGEVRLVENGAWGRKINLPSKSAISSLKWSPDGTTLVASDGTRIFRINAVSGQLVSSHEEPTGVAQLAINSDGQCLFIDQSDNIRRREMSRLRWTIQDPVQIRDIAFNAQLDQWWAATETGQIWTIESETGSVIETKQISDSALSSLQATSNAIILATEAATGKIIDCTNLNSTEPFLEESLSKDQAPIISPVGDRLALATDDGKILVKSTNSRKQVAIPIQENIEVREMAFVDNSTLAVIPSGKSSIVLLPLDSNGRGIETKSTTIASVCEIPQQNAIAIADGSDTIQVRSLNSPETKTYQQDGIAFERVLVNNNGTLLAAMGPQPSRLGVGDAVMIWNLIQAKTEPVRIDLTAESSCATWMNDNASIAVGLKDNSLSWIDASTGSLTENLPLPSTPVAIETQADQDRLWVGIRQDDSESKVISIRRRLKSRLTGIGSTIDELRVIDNRFVLNLSDSKLEIRPIPQDLSLAEESIQTITLLSDIKELQDIEVQSNGNTIAVSSTEDSPRIDVWRLPSDLPWGQSLEPSVTFPLKVAADAIHFVSDTQILVGDRAGQINLWDLSSKESLYQFVGHQSPISEITVTSEGNQFVSCSGDRGLRRWTLPDRSALENGDKIPQATAIANTNLSTVTDPGKDAAEEISAEEDVFAEVRAALLTNAGVEAEAAVFDLFEDDKGSTASVAAQYDAMRKLESSNNADDRTTAISQLVSARREFHKKRRSLTSLKRVAGSTTFADNHPNLLFNTTTDFEFNSGIRFVEPEITQGRFVYAGMSAGRDPGKLFVWDFGVSGVKTHAWTDLRLKIRELFSLPDGRGVLTLPDLEVFSQDGTSRKIAQSHRYAVSSDHSSYDGERLFAAANRGMYGREATMLQVYRAGELMNQSASAVANLSGYESEITAMSFSNVHRAIVFSVRERTGYRVLLADPVSLDVREVTLIEQGRFDKPWLLPPDEDSNEQGSRGASGPTNFAFSPDDKLLIMHSQTSSGRGGRQEEFKYTYTAFRIDWPESGLPSTSEIRKSVGPVERDGPFFDFNVERPLFFVSQTLSMEDAESSGLKMAASKNIAFRNGASIHVVNAIAGSLIRKVPIRSSGGRPQYAVTPDGRWMITGDDRGSVNLADLSNGDTFNLTEDNRPAHSGPIVGVGISATNPRLGLPEYAVTVGEENRLKVWDILGRIETRP